MTQKIPMQDDEIKIHKPISADFASFRAGIRCAERVYGVAQLIESLEHSKLSEAHWRDEWSEVCNDNQILHNTIDEAQVFIKELIEANTDKPT